MRKPLPLKFMLGLLWLQVAMALWLAVIATLCVLQPTTEGFLGAMENAFVTRLSHAKDIGSFGAKEQAQSAGYIAVSLILAVGPLIATRQRRRGLVLGFLITNIILTLGQSSLPLLSMIALILMFLPSVKAYFAVPRPFKTRRPVLKS